VLKFKRKFRRKRVKSRELRWKKADIKDAHKSLGIGSQTEERNGQIILRVYFREAAYKGVRCIYLLTTQCKDFFFGKPWRTLCAFTNRKFLQQLIKYILTKANNIVYNAVTSKTYM